MVKLGRGIGGYPYAVLHGNFGLLVIAEHAVRDQKENAAIARKQNVQGL